MDRCAGHASCRSRASLHPACREDRRTWQHTNNDFFHPPACPRAASHPTRPRAHPTRPRARAASHPQHGACARGANMRHGKGPAARQAVGAKRGQGLGTWPHVHTTDRTHPRRFPGKGRAQNATLLSQSLARSQRISHEAATNCSNPGNAPHQTQAHPPSSRCRWSLCRTRCTRIRPLPHCYAHQAREQRVWCQRAHGATMPGRWGLPTLLLAPKEGKGRRGG